MVELLFLIAYLAGCGLFVNYLFDEGVEEGIGNRE